MENLTMEQRLELAGVKTIYPPDFKFSRKEKRWNEVVLEHNGQQIVRPSAQSCVRVCKTHFGIDI